MSKQPYYPRITPIRDASFWFGIWPWAKSALFELQEDYTFTVEHEGVVHSFTIPSGYQYDRASVPKPLWSFGFTPDGLCEIPALHHDYLCDWFNGGSDWLRSKVTTPHLLPAQVIHRHFYDELLRWNMNPAKALAMWKAVRNFGPGGYLRPSSWFNRKPTNP